MAAIITEAWKAIMIARIVRPDLGTEPVFNLGLFVNTPTITPASVMGDFAAPADSLYTQLGFETMTWTPVSSSDTVTTQSTDPVFIFAGDGGGETVNGYILYDAANALLIGADTFSVPYAIPITGGALAVVVTGGINQLPLP